MSAAEKEAVMESFRSGQTQVLVSTTVVEVGVDVPNATLLAIESGQRFGLAQLHQLRGRIGRGAHPGYCCVFAEPTSPESQQRLEAFVNSTDGFELAEIDFSLRGPGDLLGTRQHGLPPCASPIRWPTPRCWKKPAATRNNWSPMTPVWRSRSTSGCAAWCWCGTGGCWS